MTHIIIEVLRVLSPDCHNYFDEIENLIFSNVSYGMVWLLFSVFDAWDFAINDLILYNSDICIRAEIFVVMLFLIQIWLIWTFW